MITSFFPGRVRLRADIFKNEEIMQAALSILKRSSVVKNIEHNPVTGSILLEYYPDKVPMEKLTPLVPLLKRLHKEAASYSETKKTAILAMLNDFAEMMKEHL